jgi:hypothetical protein
VTRCVSAQSLSERLSILQFLRQALSVRQYFHCKIVIWCETLPDTYKRCLELVRPVWGRMSSKPVSLS